VGRASPLAIDHFVKVVGRRNIGRFHSYLFHPGTQNHLARVANSFPNPPKRLLSILAALESYETGPHSTPQKHEIKVISA
jgi:hypothetical protein